MAEFTPMMKQYLEVKEENSDAILFYRLGDFYEMFFDDAKVASKELELVLTGRDCGQEERAPMCGIPYHSAEGYIARLIQKGYKVAICEQMEDPALAKGLVKREIIRTVTPGTVMESSMLEESRNNYISCVYMDTDGGAVCFCDLSTGQMSAALVSGQEAMRNLEAEMARFSPKEVLLSDYVYSNDKFVAYLRDKLGSYVEKAGEWRFLPETAYEVTKAQMEGKMDISSLDVKVIRVCGGLLSYLHETQKNGLEHIGAINIYSSEQYMQLDMAARRNLELTSTIRSGEKKGSLLGVLDDTKTAAGARLIRQWLEKPLVNLREIKSRHEAVEELMSNFLVKDELRRLLNNTYDIERIIGRIVFGSAGGRDLRSLAAVCSILPDIKAEIMKLECGKMGGICRKFDCLEDILALIDGAIVDAPPFSIREGGIIRDGYSNDVDHLRSLLDGGTDRLAEIELRERERTGIKNLRVSYNKVFGYYIEVSRGNISLVPDDYIRKQTLVNSERYITQELKELEGDVLSAKDKVTTLEYRLFNDIREKVASEVTRVQETARALAEIDVLCSFAYTAEKKRYVRPEIDLSDVIDIKEGRHPVVEQMLEDSYFVPNDAYLDCGENRAYIITGPNMAGKSTYMRQVALIVIMAQCGSFVPASEARIGICDQVFTRVGASDDISTGRSTFMVEMNEVADILKNATSRSLLILDEIGRGTSTFDGMAIARAVLEHVASKRLLGAKTLFATHYHELCDMEGVIEGIKNYSVVVKKRGDEIVFIKKIVRGGVNDSYGIEVAKLAGLPDNVVRRAKSILRDIEAGGDGEKGAGRKPDGDAGQISLGAYAGDDIVSELRDLDLNVLTPIEAMSKLYEFTKRAKEC
ncbi:MAG: DNA mismatch repair protein MutS [Clostridiaceae bacterium]|nr:DNA mismatch repair protein MutS [Clostridiaceae bacterium]